MGVTDFSTLQGLVIPEGAVTQIAKDGVVLWSADQRYSSGLFDANLRLIADWNTLVNTYGLNIQTNYALPTSATAGSGRYVLTTISELNGGSVLIIPDDVTRIGTYALAHCSNLTKIIIGNGVTELSSGAFSGCSNLASVTIPNSVKKIRSYAFAGCSVLESIKIPGSVTVIEGYVFNQCTALKDIFVPWAEGERSGAPWGATTATIHYNSEV